MTRTVLLYISTIVVMVPLDFLFLGVLAKPFFQSQVGQVMGELNYSAAILFYFVYAAGIVIFVSHGATNWQHTALFGALLGVLCYATFDLTTMALIKGWTWPAVAVDVTWGAFVTAVSATAGLFLSGWLARIIS